MELYLAYKFGAVLPVIVFAASKWWRGREPVAKQPQKPNCAAVRVADVCLQ